MTTPAPSDGGGYRSGRAKARRLLATPSPMFGQCPAGCWPWALPRMPATRVTNPRRDPSCTKAVLTRVACPRVASYAGWRPSVYEPFWRLTRRAPLQRAEGGLHRFGLLPWGQLVLDGHRVCPLFVRINNTCGLFPLFEARRLLTSGMPLPMLNVSKRKQRS